jgi:hypothetical protein
LGDFNARHHLKAAPCGHAPGRGSKFTLACAARGSGNAAKPATPALRSSRRSRHIVFTQLTMAQVGLASAAAAFASASFVSKASTSTSRPTAAG